MHHFPFLAFFHSENLYKYLIFTLTCMIKYLVGVIYAKADGLNFYETALFGTIGGVLGVVFFTYFGLLYRRIRRKIMPFIGNFIYNNFGATIRIHYLNYLRKKRKPINFHRAKKIRALWHKYGLIGLSVICPFISPMIAVFIALAFREIPRRIIIFMCTSIVIWSLILAFFLNIGAIV